MPQSRCVLAMAALGRYDTWNGRRMAFFLSTFGAGDGAAAANGGGGARAASVAAAEPGRATMVDVGSRWAGEQAAGSSDGRAEEGAWGSSGVGVERQLRADEQARRRQPAAAAH